jgi:hypothetical protein
MTTAQALETAIATYLSDVAALAGLTIYQHIEDADPMERPALIVSVQDATEDEFLKGIYRGTIRCQIEAHAQGSLSAQDLRDIKGALLDALRCEALLETYVRGDAQPWAPLRLRYAAAIDLGVTEQDGTWVVPVDLQFIAHR